ncbi:MAG: hypothetical protein WCD31_14545 [Gillisia sp.]
MYKNINSRLRISTRRNKTESNYLSNFIEWCEGFQGADIATVIEKLKIHRNINKFQFSFRNSSKWVSGSIASISMDISNKAFKIPVVSFYEDYEPGELSKEESEVYIKKLENQINNESPKLP